MNTGQAASEFAALVKHAEAAMARGDRIAALTEISRAEHHLDMMSPRERAATPDGFVRRFSVLRDVLNDDFADEVIASGFHGLGFAPLEHAARAQDKAVDVVEAVAQVHESLKRGNCESAYIDLTTSWEWLGEARAEQKGAGERSPRIDGATDALLSASMEFRKKCLRKK